MILGTKLKKAIHQRWLDVYGEIRCVKCHSKDRIERHHVYPRWKYPEMFYVKENIVPICHSCHKEFHEIYRGFETEVDFWIFLDIKAKDIFNE